MSQSEEESLIQCVSCCRTFKTQAQFGQHSRICAEGGKKSRKITASYAYKCSFLVKGKKDLEIKTRWLVQCCLERWDHLRKGAVSDAHIRRSMEARDLQEVRVSIRKKKRPENLIIANVIATKVHPDTESIHDAKLKIDNTVKLLEELLRPNGVTLEMHRCQFGTCNDIVIRDTEGFCSRHRQQKYHKNKDGTRSRPNVPPSRRVPNAATHTGPASGRSLSAILNPGLASTPRAQYQSQVPLLTHHMTTHSLPQHTYVQVSVPQANATHHSGITTQDNTVACHCCAQATPSPHVSYHHTTPVSVSGYHHTHSYHQHSQVYGTYPLNLPIFISPVHSATSHVFSNQRTFETVAYSNISLPRHGATSSLGETKPFVHPILGNAVTSSRAPSASVVGVKTEKPESDERRFNPTEDEMLVADFLTHMQHKSMPSPDASSSSSSRKRHVADMSNVVSSPTKRCRANVTGLQVPTT